MSKRRKQEQGIIALFITICAMSIYYICYALYKFITFVASIIIFYKSKYKIKSGNGYFKTMRDKGLKGEYDLYRKVAKLFGKDNVLVNVYLPCTTEGIDETEIDIVAVTNKAIYCLEMKNYKGYIFGKGYDMTWTQVFHKNAKYTFLNPVLQNKAHIQSLKYYLGAKDNEIFPLIVFGNGARLDNVKCYLSDFCYLKKAKKVLSKHEKEAPTIYTDEQKTDILAKLNEKCLATEEVKQAHIDQINEVYGNKEASQEISKNSPYNFAQKQSISEIIEESNENSEEILNNQ